MKVELRLRRGLHSRRVDGPLHTFRLSVQDDVSEHTLIEVRHDAGGVARSVRITRPVHSYYPGFVRLTADGAVVVSDSMALLMPAIPAAERRLDEQSLLDHLISWESPRRSYLAGVEVVDHGESMLIEERAGVPAIIARSVTDRFVHEDGAAWQGAADELEALLTRSAQQVRPRLNLLTGGIDSTLLQAMLRPLSASARVDSEEFAPEVELAGAAAELLGIPHNYVDVAEANLLELYAGVTRRTALPSPHLQHPLIDAVVSVHGGPVVSGYLADGVFGLSAGNRQPLRERAAAAGGAWRELAARSFVMHQRAGDRSFDAELTRWLGSPEGFYDHRLAHALERVDIPAGLPVWESFLLLGHTIDYLGIGSVNYVRDLVASRGELLLTPFTDRALIDRFHRCAVSTRYVEDGRTKPVLKHLLMRLLPTYPLDRAKLASGLPRTRYFTSGPLAAAFRRYPPPEPLASMIAEAMARPSWDSTWILWPALSYSIWYHESCARDPKARADMTIYEFMAGGVSQSVGLEPAAT
jgi:hypothetical protein